MTFNSLQFAIFLPLVFIVFYLMKNKFKWVVLLLSSFVFYSVFMQPHLIFILLFAIIMSFFCGILIHKLQKQPVKLSLLWAGIILNLVPLIYFKYSAFIILNLNYVFHLFSSDIILPKISVMNSIGISFFSFQAISYIIDVYLEKIEPEKNIGYFALYLSFFPKLLQGPIERAENLLPNLKEKYVFNYDNVKTGLIIFTWGLFKKVVVADRLAIFVNQVYNSPAEYHGIHYIMATVFYAFQLYYDFSGYTDMAIGIARLFNINLTQNFNSPYAATSIIDFWRRWHISFSKWLLDYIFVPLQMSFRNLKKLASPIALFITFIVCGIWHGASWNFIIWGALNGLYMVISIITKNFREKIKIFFGIIFNLILKHKVIFIGCLLCFCSLTIGYYSFKYSGRSIGISFGIGKQIDIKNIEVYRISFGNKLFKIKYNEKKNEFRNKFHLCKKLIVKINNIEDLNNDDIKIYIKVGPKRKNYDFSKIQNSSINNYESITGILNKNNIKYDNSLLFVPMDLYQSKSRIKLFTGIINYPGDKSVIFRFALNMFKFIVIITIIICGIILLNIFFNYLNKKNKNIKFLLKPSYIHIQIIITFTLTCIAWVFFRANNLRDVIYIFSHIFTGSAYEWFNIQTYLVGNSEYDFVLSIIFIFIIEFISLIQRQTKIKNILLGKPFIVRWIFYYLLVMSIILFGKFSTEQNQFIYFQF